MGKNNLFLGIIFTLASSLSYAILTSIVKTLGAVVDTPVIVFIQSATCLVLMLIFVAIKKNVNSAPFWRTSVIHLHIFRTIFSLGISYFLFYAVKYIPLVDGVLLANTAPLMVPFIAFVFMSQKMNHQLWIPILIGFAGVILVLQPTSGVFHPASLLALCAGICMASSMLLVRRASSKDSSMTSAFYYFLISTVLSFLASLPFWSALSISECLILMGEGALFFIVQIALTYALSYSSAQVVSSLYYSNIIFASFITIFFFKTAMTWMVLLGIILAILGGILTIRAEQKSKVLCCVVE